MPVGYVPPELLSGLQSQTTDATPDLFASLGVPAPGNFNYADWQWNPDTRQLTNKYGQGSYDYSWTAMGGNPALGTDVVYNGQTQHFGPGEAPFIGFPDGGETFISADPEAIAEYNHDRRTRNLQGALAVGTLVGGMALGGALGGGSAAAAPSTGLAPGAGVIAAPPATTGAAGIAAGAPIGSALAAGVPGAVVPAALAPGAGVLASKVPWYTRVGQFVGNNREDLLGALTGGGGQPPPVQQVPMQAPISMAAPRPIPQPPNNRNFLGTAAARTLADQRMQDEMTTEALRRKAAEPGDLLRELWGVYGE